MQQTVNRIFIRIIPKVHLLHFQCVGKIFASRRSHDECDNKFNIESRTNCTRSETGTIQMLTRIIPRPPMLEHNA